MILVASLLSISRTGSLAVPGPSLLWSVPFSSAVVPTGCCEICSTHFWWAQKATESILLHFTRTQSCDTYACFL